LDTFALKLLCSQHHSFALSYNVAVASRHPGQTLKKSSVVTRNYMQAWTCQRNQSHRYQYCKQTSVHTPQDWGKYFIWIL